MRRAILAMLAIGSITHAQDRLRAFDLPWSDRAPEVVGAALRAVATGLPDDRLGRSSARRDAARRLARERALDAMHQYADDALARVTASPSCADAVHRAIDREARVVATRPLADGSAVSIVEVDLATVRAACARDGLPWS